VPLHVTPHFVPEQLTRLHVPRAAQSMVAAPAVLETLPAHECEPEHATAQLLPLHVMSSAHALSFLHRTSHDDASQAIAPEHVFCALHATLQSLPLQSIFPAQEPLPPQLIWQELAFVQSIDEPHEPEPRQSTMQGMPAGQTTAASHALGPVQPTVHVPSGLQVPTPAPAHRSGQSAAASMGPASPSELPPSPDASASPLEPPSVPPSGSAGSGPAAP